MDNQEQGQIPKPAKPAKETNAIYILSAAFLLSAALLSGAIWMSASSVSNSIAGFEQTLMAKNFEVNTQGGQQADEGSQNQLEEKKEENPTADAPTGAVTDVKEAEGNYKETTEEVCLDEDGKLMVKMFSTTWCPHCSWQKPVLESAVEPFGDLVNLQTYDVDQEGSTPESEKELWSRYNPRGSIPTVILGCKYYQIGSGETLGEEGEKDAIRNLVCKMLGEDAPEFCPAAA